MNPIDKRGEFQGGFTQKRTRTDYIVVHHAAALYPTGGPLDDVRAVAKFHTDAPPKGRGWPGIGYHLALAEVDDTPDGEVVAVILSDPLLMRAGVWGQNHRIYSIVALTNFGNKAPQLKWIRALAAAITWARDTYAFHGAQIVGHKEITLPGHSTTCPGAAWHTWKPTLLRPLMEPDWATLWGDRAAFVANHGIPQAYMRAYRAGLRLGRALKEEELMPNGSTWQVFEDGAIEWSPQRVRVHREDTAL